MRPGSTITIEIAIREDLIEPACSECSLARESGEVDAPLDAAPLGFATEIGDVGTYSLENRSGHTVKSVWIGRRKTGTVYEPYTSAELTKAIPDGEDASIPLKPGEWDVCFWAEGNRLLGRKRVTIGPNEVKSHQIAKPKLVRVPINNETGEEITEIYFARKEGEEKVIGGSLRPEGVTLEDQGFPDIWVPAEDFDVIVRDAQDVYRVRSVELGEQKTIWVDFWQSESGVLVGIRNDSRRRICAVEILRGEDVTGRPGYTGPDILDLKSEYLKPGQGGQPGEEAQIKLEPGTYNVRALDCEGKVIETKEGWRIEGNKAIGWPVGEDCEPSVQPEGGQAQGFDFLGYLSSAGVNTVYRRGVARIPAGRGRVKITICDEDGKREVSFSRLIDPDGYVYDARLGLEALLQGATVTCDTYDEDMQTWDRWPAELYQSQINPQITGEDGYYAFFVPPGLYRVRAIAPDYVWHTSPDIRVIAEIVHYNVPMQDGRRWLPVVLKREGTSPAAR